MSAKTNRLRNRLRIEREQRASHRQTLIDIDADLWRRSIELHAAEENLKAEWKKLKRSTVLRMRVEREFDRPYGDMWALKIVMFPAEYRLAFERGSRMRNASDFAEMKGYEAGKQIAEVIARCIADELKEFEEASHA